MAINRYNIKKWTKMLMGTSIMHVDQNIGKCFSTNSIRGYYNDLTKKVTEDKKTFSTNQLPMNELEDGQSVFFPTQIFQYGLGAFDLYLLTGEHCYLSKFQMCVDWAMDNQDSQGRWNNFYFVYPDAPYSAMSQGEGASLLLRAYIAFDDERYRNAARNAIDFMLKPVSQGGTSDYADGVLVLKEYTHMAVVLNGWIFALFGLYDVCLADGSAKYREMLERSVEALKQQLPKFDNGYWSLYAGDGKIASPFYHKLHIAQMEVLFQLTGEPVFQETAVRWRAYQMNRRNKNRAFLKKAFQKIRE